MKPKRILVIGMIIFFTIIYSGCKQDEVSNTVEITLDHALAEDLNFDFVDVLYPSITNSKRNPQYYAQKFKELKNIPDLDSLNLVSRILDRDLYFYDLFDNGLISRDEFLKEIGTVDFDTVGLDPDSLRYSFNAISGFKNGQHIIVPDLNNNGDFQDDKEYNFPLDSDFSYERPHTIKDLPVVEFKYQTLINNTITSINRIIKFYPNSQNPYAYLVQMGYLDSIQNKYTVMLLFQDYWTGKKKIEEVPFDVKVYGVSFNKYPNIILKPDSISHDAFSKDNFLYSLSDTLAIKSKLYKVDSLNPHWQLFLTRIEDRNFKTTGSRIGDNISNYVLKDLNDKEFQLLEKSIKEYVLLDFWGTWCAPCKKLTPDIKELYEQNSDKFDIISIAVDDNIDNVKSYTLKNNLNWFHAYIPMANRKDPIRKELKIKAYPTFILLDKKNKILIRGNSASFPRIKSFIESIEKSS